VKDVGLERTYVALESVSEQTGCRDGLTGVNLP
jgi:hypothetical protein